MRAAVSTVTAATSAQYVAAEDDCPSQDHGGHPAGVVILCHRKAVASWRTRPPRTQCLACDRRTCPAKDRGTPTHGADGPGLSRGQFLGDAVMKALSLERGLDISHYAAEWVRDLRLDLDDRGLGGPPLRRESPRVPPEAAVN